MSKYGKQYYIDRAVKNGWGRVVRDDKYYDDIDLYDSFICFAHYTYAYLNLPAPSRAQIELLSYVSDQSNPHRMLQCISALIVILIVPLDTVAYGEDYSDLTQKTVILFALYLGLVDSNRHTYSEQSI